MTSELTHGGAPSPAAPISNLLSRSQRAKLLRVGRLLLPGELSWRKAYRLQRDGLGSVYPFHHRWQGRLDLTDAGRAALEAA